MIIWNFKFKKLPELLFPAFTIEIAISLIEHNLSVLSLRQLPARTQFSWVIFERSLSIFQSRFQILIFHHHNYVLSPLKTHKRAPDDATGLL